MDYRGTGIKTVTYQTWNGKYLIDIVEQNEQFADGTTEKVYNAWICRKNCGVKTHIIGGLAKDFPGGKKEFVERIFFYLSDDISFYEQEVEMLEEAGDL